MIDKYKGIKYPFFGWKKKPVSIRTDKNKLFVKRWKTSTEEILDDRSYPGDYGQRLFHIPVNWSFIHCSDINTLIFNDVRWGLDREGSVVDFTDKIGSKATKRNHLFKKLKVIKIVGRQVYLDGLTAPLEIPVEVNTTTTDLYAHIMTADGKWRIKKFFTYDIGGNEIG